MGLRVPIWKINFCSRVLRLSELPKCKERPQIATCCLEWLGKLKCLATGFDASLSSLSTSRRCSLNRSPGLFEKRGYPASVVGSPPRATYWSTIITTNVTKRTFRPHSIHSHVSPSQPLHTDWQIIVYIALIGVIQHSPLNWLIIAVTYTTQAAVKSKPEKKFRPERDPNPWPPR